MTKAIAAFVPKFANAAAIEKAIGSIHTRGKRLDDDIQTCGLSVLAHIEKCGDITLFVRLFEAMPKGSRRNALVEWATQCGKLSVNLDETKKDKPFLYAKDKTTDIVKAMEKPWFECKPEKAIEEEFDFASMLTSLILRAQKAEEAGKPVIGTEQLHAILGLKVQRAPAPMALPV
jgi:hypothetical protein